MTTTLPEAPTAGPTTPPVPPRWTPTKDTIRSLLSWFAAGGGLIGAVGFSLSFWSVCNAARPYLGWASWALPVLTDVAIFTLSGLSIALELFGIKAKWIRLIPDALVAYTIYLNTATQPTWFGKAVHAAGPLLWVAVVEIGAYTVRRLVGLTEAGRMDKVRASRWILAPLSTFRLWRRMRLWEVTDYKVAIVREHERAASAALLRQWHGRTWRLRAPRAERLAVRLHGVSDEPVADLLTRAALGIAQAAAAAIAPDAKQDTQQDVATDTTQDTNTDKEADAQQDTKRTRTRTTGGQSTAARVAKAAAKYPAETNAQLAKRLTLSERTVRRHRPTAGQDAARPGPALTPVPDAAKAAA